MMEPLIMPGFEGRASLSSGTEACARAVDFLFLEAELLDDRRHREWLALLTPDVRYRAPVRITTAHSLEGSALADMAHFDEDHYSLTKRVERLETEHAWAEDPPSRTRRHISNVRCWEGDAPGEILVRSSLLLFRSRGDVQPPDLLSARRTDLLRDEGDGLRLARREILLDESVLRTQNLAVFL
jgi:3-phenylpropionate/cinnamic acid dioxygenase small subunit